MIDKLIEEEKKNASLRIQQKNQLIQKKEQLDSKIALLEKRLMELQSRYLAPIPPPKFNFFQRIFFKKKYIKKQQFYTDYKIVKEEELTIQTDLPQLKKELLNLNTQINRLQKCDDENVIRVLEDREKAIIFLLEKYPDLRNDLNFMKEIVLVNYNNIQYDKTDNPELYLMIIQQLIDKYKAKALENDQYMIRIIISNLEKYFEIIKPKERINGKYRIPLKYLHESIRKKITDHDNPISDNNDYDFSGPIDDNVYDFSIPIGSYYSMNDKFPQEYGEKMQELWEDNTIRLGVHGLKGCYSPEERRNFMKDIFIQGLRTSQQQIGRTDLQFTTNVQEYTPNANFLNFLDYFYQGGGFILLAIPEECFDKYSKKPIWGGNNSKAIGQEFVLPEYVLGYVPQDEACETEEYFNNRYIIFNKEEKKAKYQYFFENGEKGKLMDCEVKEV